jgi:hypothetical protein
MALYKDQLLQAVKPLYGLSDAGVYWGQTLNDHHTQELKMVQSTGDISLLYKRVMSGLTGLSGSVDDIIRAGGDAFREESTKITDEKFNTKPVQSMPLTFTGMRIGGTDECRTISQNRYVDSLHLLPKHSDFESFRSMRAKLLWATNSRPDIACAIAFASQVTPSTFTQVSINLLNKVIKHLRVTNDIRLKYLKLELESLYLTVYSDTSLQKIPITRASRVT